MTNAVHADEPKEATTDVKPVAMARARVTKPKRQVPRGRVYVKASYNNTLVTVTNLHGDVLAWASAGSCGFRGPRKATPYAASVVIREVLRKLDGVGMRDVHVYVRGIGSGREAAVRALHANGLNVFDVKDVTPIPHNGCRPRKPRRI